MKNEFIKLLDKLVSFETISDKPENIKKCFDFIENYFKEDKNIVVDWYEKDGIQSISINFKDNLKPEMILLSHIDVVPASKKMFKIQIKKNKIFGRGVSDMKGMVALGMMLMKKYSNLDKKPSFGLVITSDEEKGGFNGAGYLVEYKILKPKVVIVPDGGDNFKITNIEKGIIHLRMYAKGVSAHGSRPWLGKNAIEIIIKNFLKIRNIFEEQNKEGWYKTINIGKICGGDVPNKVPDFAEAFLDIRYTEKDDLKKIINKIKKVVDKEIRIDILLNEPLCYTPKNNKYIIKMLKIIKQKIKQKVKLEKEHGGSDARFFSNINIPTIIVKPYAGGQHSHNEWLDIDSSMDFFDILDRFIIEN